MEIDISSKPESRLKLLGCYRKLFEPGRTGELDRITNRVETRTDGKDRAAGI